MNIDVLSGLVSGVIGGAGILGLAIKFSDKLIAGIIARYYPKTLSKYFKRFVIQLNKVIESQKDKGFDYAATELENRIVSDLKLAILELKK